MRFVIFQAKLTPINEMLVCTFSKSITYIFKKTTQPQSTINIMVNIYLLSQKCFLITENVNEINM